MAEINNLLNYFPEELLSTFTGNIEWKNIPILLKTEDIQHNQILFNLEGNPLRLSIRNTINSNLSKTNGLFWISNYNDGIVELQYLPSGPLQFFNDTLDIGFGDNIILSQENYKIDKLPKQFHNEYILVHL